MESIRYLNIKSVLADLYRDLGIDEISESDAIEWAANALEHMGQASMYTLNTAIANVENYQCEIPQGCYKVMEIARHLKKDHIDYKDDRIAIEYYDNPCGCQDCDKEPEIKIQFCQDFYLPWGFYFPIKSYPLERPHREWTWVEPSTNSFFHVSTQDKSGVNEYKVDNGKILFSFENGIVAISYLGIRLDEEGFPMVPDNVSAREAIVKYIIMKYMQRQWYLGREGYSDKWQKAEQDWHWYCKQYKTKQKMPSEDDLRKLFVVERRLFPSLSKDFFGYLNRLQDIHIIEKDKCVE